MENLAKPTSQPRDPLLDMRFGNYVILDHLGTGGMGDVYKAVHSGLDRLVALKILPPVLARNHAFSERFLAEAYAISRLQHQNIVTLYDYGEENGQKYIAMQFVLGTTLGRVIRSDGPLDFPRVNHIAKQICRGLKYAHAQEVVHRDIKSGNIMIGEGDRVYISDFGIAKVIDSPSITTTGMALGTPEFMAPEQCEGGVVDAQSDLYGLGVILFEMIAGKPPFLADTPLAVAFKQVHEIPPLLSKLRPDVPQRLELIVAKCLKKSKADRYASADELLADLDGVNIESKTIPLPTQPQSVNHRITERRGGPRRRGAPGQKDSPHWFSAIALLFLAAITGLLIFQVSGVKPEPGARWLKPQWEGETAYRLSDPSSRNWTFRFPEPSAMISMAMTWAPGAVLPEGQLLEVELKDAHGWRHTFPLGAERIASLPLDGRVFESLTLNWKIPENARGWEIESLRFLGIPYPTE
jgi:serine/threonine-protein kinase